MTVHKDGTVPNTTKLVPGRVYRVIWPGHYNQHLATTGYLGEFQRMVTPHDSHGDAMAQEARFVRIKEVSRRRSYIFDARLDDTQITDAVQ